VHLANIYGPRNEMELDANELALLEKLRAANIRIPPRSQVLQDIENMLRDENATEKMIGQLISRDASVTAELFKLVNSPFYRRGAKIDSLEQAVRLLGRKPMGEVARSAILRQQLGGNDPRMEGFWEHCADIGTICSVLCDHLERPGKLTTEQAYLVGLFHDCGVPVLVQQVKGYGAVALTPGATADFIAEDDDKMTSHCIAGLLVAQEWDLPVTLCEAIRSHHYVIAAEQPAPHAIAILQLARHAYYRHQGWDNTEWEYHAGRVMETLELSAERVDEVMGTALASFEMLH
jgi:HD-like signal output (HDOD) protein